MSTIMFRVRSSFESCIYVGKVALSVIILFTAVRVVSFIQNFIVWFYTSLPSPLSSFLDSLYLRSAILQRIFSFRLLDSTEVHINGKCSTVAEGLARQAGLDFEYHEVTSKDGYILNLHRCYSSDVVDTSRPPVFLMHGCLQSSESLLCGGSTSLAFVLAKNGHDVWLGNSRGNLYSNSHKHGCRDATFWDFCIDHFAIFDFPAAIEYVTLHTQSSKVAYIGFSQGTTSGFAALSTLPADITAKISIFVAIAPAVYPRGFRESVISSFFHSRLGSAAVSFVFGSESMLQLTRVSQRILSKSFFAAAVRNSLYYLFSCESRNISLDRQIELFQHVFSTSSVKCVKHWLQIIQSGYLGRYDTRDEYDISKINNAVAIIHGTSDELVNSEKLIKQLQNCVLYKQVVDFEHLELIWADYAHKKVFPSVVKILMMHNKI